MHRISQATVMVPRAPQAITDTMVGSQVYLRGHIAPKIAAMSGCRGRTVSTVLTVWG
jgi:hypothetical protein